MRKVEVVPYDPAWPTLFEAEAARIKEALGDNCIEVHHIGSTSVPGLAAKPVIDIIPVVKDITKVDDANERMARLGYDPQGEFGIPFRRYFQKGGNNRTHHVHIFEMGSPEIERHVKFRDWMRTHPEDRDAYGALKQRLAQQFPYDMMGYIKGKDAFIGSIDAKAGLPSQLRIMHVCTEHEKEVYHKLCAQLLEKIPGLIYSPNHPDITSPRHFHFVGYAGTNIVCAARLENITGSTWAVRLLITEETQRGKGYGTACMKLLETWIKQQRGHLIRLHAAQNAVAFYRSLGYENMPWPEDASIDPTAIDMGRKIV